MNQATAKKRAQVIFDTCGHLIREACNGTVIPPEFIAGLVENESGKNRDGSINPSASRFEPHVFRRLWAVRNTKGSKYGSITHAMVADASEDAVRALSRSYSWTQIMGYWCIILKCTLADLRDPNKHFFYTVKLLLLNNQGDFERGEYDGEMRQWNTGRETGKTYHENYVPNAKLIRAEYKKLEDAYQRRPIAERVGVLTDTPESAEDIAPEYLGSTGPDDPRNGPNIDPTLVEEDSASAPSEPSGGEIVTPEPSTQGSPAGAEQSEGTKGKEEPPAPPTVEVKAATPSLTARIGSAVTYISGLGISVGTLVQGKLESITINQVLIIIALLGVGYAIYHFSAKRAQARTLKYIENAENEAVPNVKVV